jgi:hypothetical protein
MMYDGVEDICEGERDSGYSTPSEYSLVQLDLSIVCILALALPSTEPPQRQAHHREGVIG